ncbi:hypothetical protein P7C73_g781, partial [Tremellales sp. Uapishka_1]
MSDTTSTGHGSSSLQGTVVAIYEIGCLFGSLFTFFFGERLGRRRSIMLGCSILCVGAALQTSSYGIPQLIVGRIVTGLGNGMNTSTVPVWHSETTGAHDRGRALAIELAVNIFGVMSAYWIDYGFSYVSGPAQFRVPLAIQMAFAIFTIALVIFLPESPRWLLVHGQEDEAREVLDQLSVYQGEDRQARLNGEFMAIKEAYLEEQAATVKDKNGEPVSAFRACFTFGKERYFHRVMLGVGSQFMQQLCGINLRAGNLSRVGRVDAQYFALAVWLQRSRLFLIFPNPDMDDRTRWKVCGQCACMAVLAGTTSVQHKGTGIVAATMLFLFNFFFAVGLLAIPWLLPSEYAPLPIRTSAAALASGSNWIFTFLVVEITPVSISTIGYKTYVYFCIFNACFIPIIYWFYPETTQLSLEQIGLCFSGDKVLLHLPAQLRGYTPGEETPPNELGDDNEKKNEPVGDKTHVTHIEKTL